MVSHSLLWNHRQLQSWDECENSGRRKGKMKNRRGNFPFLSLTWKRNNLRKNCVFIEFVYVTLRRLKTFFSLLFPSPSACLDYRTLLNFPFSLSFLFCTYLFHPLRMKCCNRCLSSSCNIPHFNCLMAWINRYFGKFARSFLSIPFDHQIRFPVRVLSFLLFQNVIWENFHVLYLDSFLPIYFNNWLTSIAEVLFFPINFFFFLSLLLFVCLNAMKRGNFILYVLFLVVFEGIEKVWYAIRFPRESLLLALIKWWGEDAVGCMEVPQK